MFGLSSAAIVALGVYGTYRATYIDAATAVKSSVDFVIARYNVASGDAQFSSLTQDDKTKVYTVDVKNARVTGKKYVLTLDGFSGNVTGAKEVP